MVKYYMMEIYGIQASIGVDKGGFIVTLIIKIYLVFRKHITLTTKVYI